MKVAQPQNTADINLRYETGERYEPGNIRISHEQSKPRIPFGYGYSAKFGHLTAMLTILFGV